MHHLTVMLFYMIEGMGLTKLLHSRYLDTVYTHLIFNIYFIFLLTIVKAFLLYVRFILNNIQARLPVLHVFMQCGTKTSKDHSVLTHFHTQWTRFYVLLALLSFKAYFTWFQIHYHKSRDNNIHCTALMKRESSNTLSYNNVLFWLFTDSCFAKQILLA